MSTGMDIEQRSIKYVEFHMFETFNPIFIENMQEIAYWHDNNGLPRYESVVGEISYLFPPFDPESDEYDTYEMGED